MSEADEVALRPDGGGATLLPVKAQPGARRAGIAGTWDGHLKLAVTAPAERGRANAAIVALAARLFGLRPSSVELVRGHSAARKVLRLERDPAEVRERLRELLD